MCHTGSTTTSETASIKTTTIATSTKLGVILGALLLLKIHSASATARSTTKTTTITTTIQIGVILGAQRSDAGARGFSLSLQYLRQVAVLRQDFSQLLFYSTRFF